MSPQKRFTIKRPSKEETLAIKREERIKRQSALRMRLAQFAPEGWVGAGEMVALVFLFLINFRMISPFFGREDVANVFSAPLLPILTSLFESLMPHPYAVRIWLLVFLSLFPVTFYLFVREVSGRKLVALLSSLIASLPIGIFLPMRIELGLLGQDGAHIASLTMTPLVSFMLLRFLKKGTFLVGVFSALGTALVAMTSPLGLLILITFMFVMTFSEMLLGRARIKFLRFLVVVFLAAGFSAFWYHPKFVILMVQSTQGKLIKKTIFNLLPISFFIVPVLGVVGFLLFENRPQLQPLFIACFLSVIFGLFSLGAGVAHPFPSRFLPSFGIAFSFLIGFLVVWFFDFLRLSPKVEQLKKLAKYRKAMAIGMMILTLALIVIICVLNREGLTELAETRVLGLTERDQLVGIWEIKEQTTRFESLFGYTITGLTFLLVGALKLKLVRNNKVNFKRKINH